jgi:hypothetical protein
MTRDYIISEIARIDATAPSKFASFNTARAALRAELVAKLAAMPTEPVAFDDAGLARWDASQRKAANADRAQTRRGY